MASRSKTNADGRPLTAGGSIWPHFRPKRPQFGPEIPRFGPKLAPSNAGAQE